MMYMVEEKRTYIEQYGEINLFVGNYNFWYESSQLIQKQIKETLARLTSKDKGLKKGAKWRKEKREASANRALEAAELEQAESKVLKLTEFVTANDLAVMMNVPINNVIATCMVAKKRAGSFLSFLSFLAFLFVFSVFSQC